MLYLKHCILFPKEDAWNIGSMSPKVIIRQNSVLVDSNTLEPIDGKVKQIKTELPQTKDKDHLEELKQQLQTLYENSKYLIDLTGKLLVFFEPPRPETWDILKPILSHDRWEIEHPFVDKSEVTGTIVKKIVTRGWPACIFCTARNESSWPQWPEIQSRFLITSPNMIPQKYLEGNILIAQRMGLPKLMQESLIVSNSDVELAKKCVFYLIQQMNKFATSTTNPSPVWIPFGEILAQILPSDILET
jgi:hypothetical protein